MNNLKNERRPAGRTSGIAGCHETIISSNVDSIKVAASLCGYK